MRKITELIADLQKLDPDTWTDIEAVKSEIALGSSGRRKLICFYDNPKTETNYLKP